MKDQPGAGPSFFQCHFSVWPVHCFSLISYKKKKKKIIIHQLDCIQLCIVDIKFKGGGGGEIKPLLVSWKCSDRENDCCLAENIFLHVITKIYDFYQPFPVPRCSTDQKKNCVLTPTATEPVSGTSWTLLLCILQQWTASRFTAAKQHCSSMFALTIFYWLRIRSAPTGEKK